MEIFLFALIAGMTWIKLDDNAVDHPKVESLSDRAFRWWIKGLSYASRFLTDGVLPPVFWKKVPTNDRKELTGNHLWDWVDPNFQIHDYAKHQTLKEDVEADKERNRQNSKAYRERRRAERRQPNVSADASANRQHPVSAESATQRTENREQRTDTETTKGEPVIVGPAQYLRLQQKFAFVGSRLKVPHSLHQELLGKSGGPMREDEMQRWYLSLNDRLEETNTGTGDVFEWLRPRHQSFAVLRGWIEPAPKPVPLAKPKPRGVAELLAEEAARKAGRAS